MGRGSLRRLGMEKVAIGQLHWSAANYAPLQERALWDGLVGMYEEVGAPHCLPGYAKGCSEGPLRVIQTTYSVLMLCIHT